MTMNHYYSRHLLSFSYSFSFYFFFFVLRTAFFFSLRFSLRFHLVISVSSLITSDIVVFCCALPAVQMYRYYSNQRVSTIVTIFFRFFFCVHL